MTHRILIVEGHPMFTDALVRTLHGTLPDIDVAVAGDAKHAGRLAEEASGLDLVLLDMKLPDAASLDDVSRVATAVAPAPVAVVSDVPDRHFAERCLARGAVGIIDKSADRDAIRRAVRSLLAGQGLHATPREPRRRAGCVICMRSLSRQQDRVLVLLSQGLSNRAIAKRMGIKEATVKSHVSRLFRCLGVKSRTQAVLHYHDCRKAHASREAPAAAPSAPQPPMDRAPTSPCRPAPQSGRPQHALLADR